MDYRLGFWMMCFLWLFTLYQWHYYDVEANKKNEEIRYQHQKLLSKLKQQEQDTAYYQMMADSTYKRITKDWE